MIGCLVTLKWMEESLCIVLEGEKRKISSGEFYHIYHVYDFITGERYWVDEDDLEKV
jgi:hypothetical protein